MDASSSSGVCWIGRSAEFRLRFEGVAAVSSPDARFFDSRLAALRTDLASLSSALKSGDNVLTSDLAIVSGLRDVVSDPKEMDMDRV